MLSEFIKCEQCGKEVKRRNGTHRFCSARCKAAYADAHKMRHTANCPVCGEPFEYYMKGRKRSKSFCSVACQLKATVPEKVCTCIDCGKSFSFHGRTTKLRCDKCRNKHRSQQTMLYRQRKDPSVQIGVGSGGGQNSSDGLVNTPERDAMRAYRRLRYQQNAERYRASASYKYRRILTGHDVCAICGFSTYQDALVVHHLDMDRTHNTDDNLVILCSNCHVHLHAQIKQRQKLSEVKAEELYETIKSEMKPRAETKERNEAGRVTDLIRTEGCEESQSGATRSSTSRPDMSCQEAVPLEQIALF